MSFVSCYSKVLPALDSPSPSGSSSGSSTGSSSGTSSTSPSGSSSVLNSSSGVVVGTGVGVLGSEGISSVLQSPVSGFMPNSHCGCDRARRLGSTEGVGVAGVGSAVGVTGGVGVGVCARPGHGGSPEQSGFSGSPVQPGGSGCGLGLGMHSPVLTS